MTKTPENEVATTEVQSTLSTNDIVIGVNTDVSNMTLDDREQLFIRYSEAQAGVKIEDSLLNREVTATDLTVYQRDFVDQETGEIGLATYVAFVLADGSTFKTASSMALPFATSVARFIGYDPKTGHLPHAIKFLIQPQKVETGFKYNFIFKGLAK